MLKPELRDRLALSSTATLSTCLFKRGFRNQMIQDVHLINPAAPPMVGFATTLRYIPAREDLDRVEAFRDPGHPQRRAVEECPEGAVLVIDSRKDPRAASAGGILVTRLMKRGAAGVVTDGGFRDSPDIAKLDFPAYHQRPSAPTNITRHHAVDIDDKEGVLVIPAGIAEEVAAEAAEMTVFEDFVIEQVENGRSIFGLYPATDPATTVAFAE